LRSGSIIVYEKSLAGCIRDIAQLGVDGVHKGEEIWLRNTVAKSLVCLAVYGREVLAIELPMESGHGVVRDAQILCRAATPGRCQHDG